MKIEDLPSCLKNSWCVEKHWEAIIKVLLIAKRGARSQELIEAILELEAIP